MRQVTVSSRSWRTQRTTHAPRPFTLGRMPTQPPADGPQAGDIDTFEARRHKIDRRIAATAEAQHGLVTLDQLCAVGLSGYAVRKRVDSGRLYPVYRGIYAVGYPLLTQEGRFMAAVLACGPNAVLSHRSAAVLWGIREDDRSSIDVTAPNRRGRIPVGIEAHRDGSLVMDDRAQPRRIPCTSVARTLLDLAGVVPVWELRKAVSEAEVLRVLDLAAMHALIRRSGGRRGVARLRLLLEEVDPATKRTRSELERRFLRMCVRVGLPRPEVNVSIAVGGRHLEVDFLWRDAGLIVEVDGQRYHGTASAFERDRRRDQRLQLAGWRVARFTWRQIERESRDLVITIRGLLAQHKSLPTGLKREI
jgi:very-short-patch-repair endonuclease